MFNFFAHNPSVDNCYYIEGTDLNHIKNVLRMEVGNRFLVSFEGHSDLCELMSLDGLAAKVKIIEENYMNTELPVKIYLFQGLPKSDKMEFIIQKAVELGVEGIVPMEMEHCVVKLDGKKKKSKQQRWQMIAESAAKQSKRNCVPQVFEAMNYKQAVKMASEMDVFMLPYENKEGMKATLEALKKIKSGKKIAVFIGPEGGFAKNEVKLAEENGAVTVSLGKRILRTETAAITAVSMCMLYCEMNEDKL